MTTNTAFGINTVGLNSNAKNIENVQLCANNISENFHAEFFIPVCVLVSP